MVAGYCVDQVGKSFKWGDIIGGYVQFIKA